MNDEQGVARLPRGRHHFARGKGAQEPAATFSAFEADEEGL